MSKDETIWMKQPLVSFGLPAFKGVHFAEALRSIKNQSYRNIEVIVQDDASPDDLKAIFDSEVGDDNRFSYGRNEKNTAPDFVKNWNIVLSKANGDFFVLASDDDVYEPTFVEHLLALAIKYSDVNIFSALYDRFDDSGVVGLVAKPAEFESQTECMYAMVIENRYPIAPNVMVRTEALRKSGGFVNLPAATASDYLTWLRIAKSGFVTAPKYLLHWRFDGTSVTSEKGSRWSRQKYLSTKLAYSIWLGLCRSLEPNSPQEVWQKTSLLRFFENRYDDWMMAQFTDGMNTKEYFGYLIRCLKRGKLTIRGFLRKMATRVFMGR